MDLFDIFGLIFVGAVFIGAFAVSLYILVYFSHPLDKDIPGVWIIRVQVILGMTVAFMMVFIVPVDLLSSYQM